MSKYMRGYETHPHIHLYAIQTSTFKEPFDLNVQSQLVFAKWHKLVSLVIKTTKHVFAMQDQKY
jgi:hypothetical protein